MGPTAIQFGAVSAPALLPAWAAAELAPSPERAEQQVFGKSRWWPVKEPRGSPPPPLPVPLHSIPTTEEAQGGRAGLAFFPSSPRRAQG